MLLGENTIDSQCTDSYGLGWIAALYFVVFILIAVMILLSLFVGIIIAAMDLLKSSVKEEKEVWARAMQIQQKYKYGDAAISSLLEMFDMIDTSSNGKLKVIELVSLQCTVFNDVSFDIIFFFFFFVHDIVSGVGADDEHA